MAKVTPNVFKAVARSKLPEHEIVAAIDAAGQRDAPAMQTPSDEPRKRKYKTRDMTAEG